MVKVFISGSRTIQSIPNDVISRIDNIINNNHTILIGDCYGVDSLVQQYLSDRKYKNVLVYTIKHKARHNKGFNEKRINSFYQKDKDIAMSEDCDFGLAIIHNNSVGTLNNVKRLKSLNKKCVVYTYNS